VDKPVVSSYNVNMKAEPHCVRAFHTACLGLTDAV